MYHRFLKIIDFCFSAWLYWTQMKGRKREKAALYALYKNENLSLTSIEVRNLYLHKCLYLLYSMWFNDILDGNEA